MKNLHSAKDTKCAASSFWYRFTS